MNRLDTLLLLVVLACALSIVNATYQQRRIFAQLEREQSQERRLTQDWSRLQYEQSALSKTSRVEDVAQSQLKMFAVTSGRTQYLPLAPQLAAERAADDARASSTPTAAAAMDASAASRAAALASAPASAAAGAAGPAAASRAASASGAKRASRPAPASGARR